MCVECKLHVIVAGVEFWNHFAKKKNQEGENHRLHQEVGKFAIEREHIVHRKVEHNHDEHIHYIVANQDSGKKFFGLRKQFFDVISCAIALNFVDFLLCK